MGRTRDVNGFLAGLRARVKAALRVPAERLAEQTRQLVSVPAPLVRGRPTRATPGAPPRKVTGKLLASVGVRERPEGWAVVVAARYAKPLENRGHKHLTAVWQREKHALAALFREGLKA